MSESAAYASLPYGEICTTTHRIVIVSPFPYSLNELIQELTADCYDVLVFHHMDAQELNKLPIDLLIMDVSRDTASSPPARSSLPEGVPALFLVNRDAWTEDQVGTFPWPVRAKELLIRMESVLLQKASPITFKSAAHQLNYKDLQIDLKRMTCLRGTDRVDLTKTEFDLLQALIESGGTVLSRQHLMDRIWGENYFGGSNTIDVHMKSLRQKLKDNPKAPKYIATVRGIGYRLADDGLSS